MKRFVALFLLALAGCQANPVPTGYYVAPPATPTTLPIVIHH